MVIMKTFNTIAALCAALFLSTQLLAAEMNMLKPFPNSELSCQSTEQATKVILKTTNADVIQVKISSKSGNTMKSQVSGHSSNQFQFSISDLPLNLELISNRTALTYQVVMEDSECHIVTR